MGVLGDDRQRSRRLALDSAAPYTYGAKFRDHDLTVLQTKPLALTGPFATCFGPNGSTPSYTMFQMRADVRRFLPLQYDASGHSTGKRLVNASDLAANRDPVTNLPYGPHTIMLPEAGNGNNVPVTAGASLVVVYKLNNAAEPLRKIVFYDGLGVLPNLDGASLVQPLRGIYQSAADAGATLTMIGAGECSTSWRYRASLSRSCSAATRRAVTSW